ncbi:MAG TPA: cell division protein FtsQ/DivIB [Rhizobiaceae bacterium]|nr:cell division protein FtsQ/DivIB [Rhizobiaceae bacterium]
MRRKGRLVIPGAAAASQAASRLSRRSLRYASRLARGDVDIPRHAGAVLLAAFFAATGVYGASLGGQLGGAVNATASTLGFAINEVNIKGNRQTSEIDLIQRLGLDGHTSIAGLDPETARIAILDLPWVASASVRKDWPGSISVELTEHQPFAIWQQGDTLSVIAADGSVIAPYESGEFASLPLVIGIGANAAAKEFVAVMRRHPYFSKQADAFIRVGNRRWNLRLMNGVTLKLPESGLDAALDRLAAWDIEEQVLERDIVAIDLRLDDRITVKLTDAAAERRDEALKQRAKLLAKAEKRV